MFRPVLFRAARLALSVASLSLLSPAARALVVGGSAAVQETAPADDPGWANAVMVGGASGVYLGNGWVLTAAHVGAAPVTIGAANFAVQPGTEVRLRRPDASGATDLVMFRIVGDPGLPALPVAAATAAEGTALTFIGHGRTRGAAASYNFDWAESSTDPIFLGYQWGDARKAWGRNRVNAVVDIAYDDNVVRFYETVFDEGVAGEADEAQGALGDSGGPVFAKVGGTWQLAGVMLQASFFEGQPDGAAIFGNATYAADLSVYRAQIEALRARTTAYGVWEYVAFQGAETGALDDPDHDGLNNLQEFAFGLDPRSANAAAAPHGTMQDFSGTTSLTLTYQRDTAAKGIDCVVEVSSDLVSWISGDGVTAVVQTETLGGTVQRITVRDLADAATQSRRFMRLRVSQP